MHCVYVFLRNMWNTEPLTWSDIFFKSFIIVSPIPNWVAVICGDTSLLKLPRVLTFIFQEKQKQLYI